MQHSRSNAANEMNSHNTQSASDLGATSAKETALFPISRFHNVTTRPRRKLGVESEAADSSVRERITMYVVIVPRIRSCEQPGVYFALRTAEETPVVVSEAKKV